MNKPGRVQPTMTRAAKPIKFDTYCSELQKESLTVDQKECLFFGAFELASTINKTDIVTNNHENIFAIPSLIIASKILVENKYPLVSNSSSTFKSCLKAAQKYYEPADGIFFDFEFNGGSQKEEDVIGMFVWIMSSNHSYQGDMIHEIANTLILSGLAEFKSLKKDSQQIDALFSQYVGVDAIDYYMTLFALWSSSINGFHLNTSTFLLKSQRKNALDKALKDICNSLSFKSSEPLSSKMFGHARKYTGKAKAESILALRPLVQVGDEVFLFAGHPFLKIQCTRKFLPKALFYARQSSGGQPSTAFSQFVGQTRFEQYFCDLCDVWTPKGGHFDEYYWDIGKSQLSPDRIAFEQHGSHDVVTLFQLKGKTLLEASLFGDFSALKKDIQSAFSEMIYKTINFLWAIHNARTSGQLDPSTKDISERILDAKYCVLIGVSPDVAPIFTSRPIREILIEEVKAKSDTGAWDWFNSHFERVKWHILSLHEFQAFLCIPPKKRDFYKTITHYFRDSQLETCPISPGSGFPESYRSYVINRHGSGGKGKKKIEPIPELKGIFDSLTDDIKKYFDFK